MSQSDEKPRMDGGGREKDRKEGYSGRKPQFRFNNQRQMPPRQPKFEGICGELRGHIYDCSDAKQADLFAKTSKEIAEYIGRTFKYGGDIRLTVENLKKPTIDKPDDPPTGATNTDMKIWEKEIEDYVRRKNQLNENIKTLYSLVWGQCTDIMRQKVASFEGFAEISSALDGLGLLMAIKDMAFNFESQKYAPHSLRESLGRLYALTQGKFQSTQAYLEQFRNMVEVIEHTGGEVVGRQSAFEKTIMAERKIDKAIITTAQQLEVTEEATNRFLAIVETTICV